ncbi:hypothetical protein H0H93_006924 [Arthromyces matolae]|nr:hypothetical protein H0H93_006924 [Arthromyces matolae]
MGWSLGNTTALTLFSQKDLLPQANYEILESYVKTLIIYDATLFAFGWAPSPEDKPPIVFEPLSNFSADEMPSEEAKRSFHAWVSSYYDHPANPELLSELHFAERTAHATSDNWNAQDLAAFVDYGAVMRSEIPMQVSSLGPEVKVLGLGPGQTPASRTMAFPKCHIVFLRPTRTTWRCYWFGIRAQRIYEKQKKLGKDMRPAIFLPIEGGNHFAHWDMPEKVIENVAFGVHHNRSTLPT